jgi:hypothetical protein
MAAGNRGGQQGGSRRGNAQGQRCRTQRLGHVIAQFDGRQQDAGLFHTLPLGLGQHCARR